MNTSTTLNFITALATGLVIAGSLYAVSYLRGLKKRINTSIILVPLYKSKAFLIIGASIMLILIGVGTIYLIYTKVLFITICTLIMLVFVLALLITLITQRFAVIDTGIIAPYRYIDWICFKDYEIDGRRVYFTGDKYGFKSLSSTTIMLSFNSSDLNKLNLILSRNKKRNHTEHNE